MTVVPCDRVVVNITSRYCTLHTVHRQMNADAWYCDMCSSWHLMLQGATMKIYNSVKTFSKMQ